MEQESEKDKKNEEDEINLIDLTSQLNEEEKFNLLRKKIESK